MLLNVYLEQDSTHFPVSAQHQLVMAYSLTLIIRKAMKTPQYLPSPFSHVTQYFAHNINNSCTTAQWSFSNRRHTLDQFEHQGCHLCPCATTNFLIDFSAPSLLLRPVRHQAFSLISWCSILSSVFFSMHSMKMVETDNLKGFMAKFSIDKKPQ
jgi:hypothetical protein